MPPPGSPTWMPPVNGSRPAISAWCGSPTWPAAGRRIATDAGAITIRSATPGSATTPGAGSRTTTAVGVAWTNIGWVWQPSANPIFHPGDVYWLRGANFTGWGPLTPGELWNEPNPGTVTPQGYLANSTTYAAFRPDLRAVDGAGFSAPTPEQLKTAVFIPALPSPAFLISRLDAVRPTLQVGATRVLPSVPGVAFGDGAAPPSDLMTNPPVDPGPPPVSDVGIAPPPDGVYPAPVVLVPVVEVPLIINPSGGGVPTYSPRRPGGTAPTTTTTAPTNPPSTTSTSTGNRPARPSGIRRPPRLPPRRAGR